MIVSNAFTGYYIDNIFANIDNNISYYIDNIFYTGYYIDIALDCRTKCLL